MSNNPFIQFVESFKGITSIIPIKNIEKSFSNINLPLEKQNDLTYDVLSKHQKRIIENLYEIQQLLYRAFLREKYSINIFDILNNNLVFLNNQCYWIKQKNPTYLKDAYSNKIQKSHDNYFWELFYEIDIMTYFEKNVGNITYLEPPAKKSANSCRTLDFHLDIGKGQKIYVEIMTLSESGHQSLARKHEKELDRIFKEVFQMPLAFHFFPENNYNYTKNDLKLFREKLTQEKEEILKSVNNGRDYSFTFQLNLGNKSDNKVEYQISLVKNIEGICLTSIDPLKNYKYEDNFKKIPEKYLTKKTAFPKGGLNFLLVNISHSNPLYYCYLLKEKENSLIHEQIQQCNLTPPLYWCAIDRFEEPFLVKGDFDDNLSGIIFHKYIGPDFYSNRKLDIYQNPKANIKIPQALYDKIET